MNDDSKKEPRYQPLGKHADQTIREMIHEEIIRHDQGLGPKPYPDKEGEKSES